MLAPSDATPKEPWVRAVGRPLRIPYAGTVAPVCFSWASWHRVRREVRAFAPDVVHVHEPFAPGTAMFATLAALPFLTPGSGLWGGCHAFDSARAGSPARSDRGHAYFRYSDLNRSAKSFAFAS